MIIAVFLIIQMIIQTSARAQSRQAQNPSTAAELADLQARVARLEEQQAREDSESSPTMEDLTRLRLELQVPEPLGQGFTSFGPAASKVYSSRTPLSLGGYGEVHYTSTHEGSRATNLVRLNPLLGYRFSRTIVFNSGFSFQNGGSVAGAGAARVEYAYLDFFV